MKWGHSWSVQKFVATFHLNFWGICCENISLSWPNSGPKCAIPDFQVSMATFSNFYEFWFITWQRPIFVPNMKFLALMVAP